MRSGTVIIGLVLAALVAAPFPVDAATAVDGPSASNVGNPPSVDECQGCTRDYFYNSLEGHWFAWYAYEENDDGYCDAELGGDCRRCNGNPGCEGELDAKTFSSGGDAAMWLELNSDCGNCSEAGGGVERLARATESQDAAAVAQLISTSNGSAWLNHDRVAVQARGCAGAGSVGVHIPIDAAFLAEVTVELDRIEAAGQRVR